MKTQIIESPEQRTEIDWSKPQLVESEEGLIVLTSGVHEKSYFCGTAIKIATDWEVGYYSDSWNKSLFQPITTPVTIKFIPE